MDFHPPILVGLVVAKNVHSNAYPPLPETIRQRVYKHLKMDGWNTIVFFWGKRPIFKGELLVLGSVIHLVYTPCRMPVTTRMITFLVGNPNLNLHLLPSFVYY